MSVGGTVENERLNRLFDQTFEQEPSDTGRMDRLLDEVFTPIVEQVPDPFADLTFIARMAQAAELEAPDPDRPIIEEAGVGVLRGLGGLVESSGGLGLLAAGQIEKSVGDNPLSRFIETVSAFQLDVAALTRARFPRSQEPGFTARRTVGDVGEALPGLGFQVGAALGTGPIGGTAVRVGTFAATGASQVVGQQYIAALAATGDPDLAAAEAAGAGLITLGLNSIPGFAAFRRFPGSQRFFMDAAVRVGRRMALVGVTESVEEMSEAVLIDAYASMVRDDPSLAAGIFNGDPEYWSDVLRQGIAGFFAGATIGIALGGMESTEREQLIREVAAITETVGALQADQVATAQRFISMVGESQRQRDLARQFRRRVAGEPVPEIDEPVIEPRVGEEFIGEGRRVRIVSKTDQQVTIQTKPGETTTIPTKEFAQRYDAVDTRRRLPPEQLTREAKRIADEQAKKEPAQDIEREVLDELSTMRNRVERGEVSIQQTRNDLARLARENIKGPSVPKPVLTAIAKASTPAGITRGILQIRRAVAQQRRTKAIQSAQKAVAKAAKSKGFRTEIIRGLKSVARGFKAAGLSKDAQRSLKTLIGKLERSLPGTMELLLRDELKRLSTLSPKQTPVDEIRQIASAIESQARFVTARRVLTRKFKLARLRRLSIEMANEIVIHTNPRPTRRGRILSNSPNAISSLFRITFGLIEKMELDTLGEFIGGADSTTWRALSRAIELGQSDGLGGYFGSIDRLREFMEAQGVAFGSEELTRLSEDLTGTSTTLGATLSAIGFETPLRIEAETRTVALASGEEIDLSPAEIMGLAALVTDEETRAMIETRGTPVRFRGEAVGKSRKLTQADLVSITSSLRPLEQSIVDFMVSEVNGPIKETMRAWSIQELGFDMTKPETWWTRHRRIEGETEKPTTLSNLRAKFLQTVGFRPGLTRARGRDVRSPIEVRDIFVDFNTVAWQTNMVAHQAPPLQDARALLRSRPVREVLANSKASQAQLAYDTIFDQIAREITGVPSTRGIALRRFDPIIQNLPRGLLGFNPRVAAYQAVSAIMAQSEIPPQFLVAAANSGLDAEVEERMKLNPIMRLRMETSAMGLVNEGSDLTPKLLGFGARGEGPMFMIRFMDRVAVRIVWRAAELQAESEGLKDAALRERTWDIGVRAISRTQPMFDSVHIAERAIEARAKGGLFRMTNFFRAQRNKLETMVIRSVIRMRRSPDRRTQIREAKNIAITTIGNSIAIASIRNLLTVGTLVALVTGKFPEKEERDKFMQGFAADLIRTLGGIPFMGDWIAEMVVLLLPFEDERLFEPEFTVIGGIIGDAQRGFAKMDRGLEDRDVGKMLDGAVQLFGNVAAVVGIPAMPIIREVRNVIDELIDKDDRTTGRTPP